MNDLTILYYTANVENKSLENKVKENILNVCDDLPIISISQKPIEFGHNICVEKHDNCYYNEFRQIQIGLKEVKTNYVIVTEADCLYPPDYFKFRPKELGHCYRYNNVWVHYTQFKGAPKFRQKGFSDCAQIIDVNIWTALINKALDEKLKWGTKRNIVIGAMPKARRKYIWSGDPIITFKTKKGVKSVTQVRSDISPQYNLPYWGSAKDIREKYI